jgi:putative transcriptional regulator
MLYCHPAQHPEAALVMITCHLSTLMGREKLKIADVARLTGLNRSTVAALYNDTYTRLDVTTIDQLCRLFNCQVNDIWVYSPDKETQST